MQFLLSKECGALSPHFDPLHLVNFHRVMRGFGPRPRLGSSIPITTHREPIMTGFCLHNQHHLHRHEVVDPICMLTMCSLSDV